MIATHIENKEGFKEKRIAGSFHLGYYDEEDNTYLFWYCCTCGCGNIVPLTVGKNYKPSNEFGATWDWNGSLEKPTLKPSVNHVNHWHGWLTDGEWKSC